MPSDHHQQARLISWLEEQGHSEPEIQKILAKVDEYDARTVHESLFDAIDRGEIDLESIVKEALGGGPTSA
jgi:hypothetical protein